jgi:hypothetical protein
LYKNESAANLEIALENCNGIMKACTIPVLTCCFFFPARVLNNRCELMYFCDAPFALLSVNRLFEMLEDLLALQLGGTFSF